MSEVDWDVRQGDCIELMRAMPNGCIDAIVTDPPYGLGFMGKKWDALPPGREWAEWCLRVLRPGGHLLAFGGTRTYHRLTCAIEDGGFEIRDCIAWMYGSGFPKSRDVSKAIDEAAGAGREIVGTQRRKGRSGGIMGKEVEVVRDLSEPASDDGKRWAGWGTALKPAFEPVVVARKPPIVKERHFSRARRTVDANVLEHGAGGLNIDGCRIDTGGEVVAAGLSDPANRRGVVGQAWQAATSNKDRNQQAQMESLARTNALGRWPANVILDEEAGEMLDAQTGELASGNFPAHNRTGLGGTYRGNTTRGGLEQERRPTSSGGASRFFYCAKASKKERNAGVEKNVHPTVKPIALMRYLVRLVTPPGGRVLDPFAGSGTTGIAAVLEGFNFVGLERDSEYVAIAQARIAHWKEYG